MTKQIGIKLEVVDFSKEHFEMLKNPKHGLGKNMNPCIDCHAMMMRYAGELLEKLDADFIITGEVLNQRPMSQNKQALNTVKKESGFSDKILRPLCALNLEPTEMEKNGLVDKVWQYFTVVPDFRSTGIKNDKRAFEWCCIVRAVNTTDVMTATVANLPYELMCHITDRITHEVPGINRVLYDFTPKPTGTVEFE